MRPRTITKAKSLSNQLNCDLCRRKFQTLAAFRSHQLAKHPSRAKSDPKLNKKKIIDKSVPKTAASAAGSRVSKRLMHKKVVTVKKSVKKDEIKAPVKTAVKIETKMLKTKFECPACSKLFPVCFQAVKHIQKKHCEDAAGNAVSPNSSLLIKPICREICEDCDMPITREPHICNEEMEVSSYQCLGCDKKFSCIGLFNEHLRHDHEDSLEEMNFGNSAEFTTWKLNMESIVKVVYSILDKTLKKQYYQCSYVSPKNMKNITYLCPSVICVEDTSSGIDIQYFRKHCGHTTPPYNTITDSKKTPALENTESENKVETFHNKFKGIMEDIIEESASVDLNILKRLLLMALDMQVYLSNETEEPLNVTSKSMTDEQISQELEVAGGKVLTRSKRKTQNVPPVEAKKKKIKADSNENKPNDNVIQIRPLVQSPSFNDSYKQFVDSNFKNDGKNGNSLEPKRRGNYKKEVVKTKIGQFSPKKASPKSEDLDTKKPNILKPKSNTSPTLKGSYRVNDIKYEVREQENDCNILVLKI